MKKHHSKYVALLTWDSILLVLSLFSLTLSYSLCLDAQIKYRTSSLFLRERKTNKLQITFRKVFLKYISLHKRWRRFSLFLQKFSPLHIKNFYAIEILSDGQIVRKARRNVPYCVPLAIRPWAQHLKHAMQTAYFNWER